MLNPFVRLIPTRSEDEMLKFMGLMNSSWVLDGHDIVTAFNLASFHNIIDLGGERKHNYIEYLNCYVWGKILVCIWPHGNNQISKLNKLLFLRSVGKTFPLCDFSLNTVNSCFHVVLFEKLPGCTGALAREMAKAYPSSSVTVFDLPQVVETAQKHFSQENDAVAFQTGEPRIQPEINNLIKIITLNLCCFCVTVMQNNLIRRFVQ